MYMPPSKIECVDNDKHMTLLFWCHISCADFALPFLWAHKSSLTPSFFFKYLYQAMKACGNVYVCWGFRF